MKVLSLKEPFATLIKDGIKTIDRTSIGFSSGDSKELVQNVDCKSNQYINLKQIIMNTSYED